MSDILIRIEMFYNKETGDFMINKDVELIKVMASSIR